MCSFIMFMYLAYLHVVTLTQLENWKAETIHIDQNGTLEINVNSTILSQI
jgi:hypothetical protein